MERKKTKQLSNSPITIDKLMKKEEIVDFYFPSNELNREDFLPVDILVLKDYYRNSFLSLINSNTIKDCKTL